MGSPFPTGMGIRGRRAIYLLIDSLSAIKEAETAAMVR